MSEKIPLNGILIHPGSIMSQVIFTCLSSDFSLRWLRNGTEIDLESDYRYSLIDGAFIISNPSEAKDFGHYQCLAANTFGSILSREVILQFACE